MLKSKPFCIAMVIVGGSLFAIAILGARVFEIPKMVAGVGIGIATPLFAVGLTNLLNKLFETAQPEAMRQTQIEFYDERNTMIRDKAKAKASDITQWFIVGIFYIAILVEAPQWIFFALVGIYLLKNILEVVFNIKYQKEL